MRYRFRKTDRKGGSRLRKGVTLRFAGKNTLRLLRPLPEPIEEIRINDDELFGKKKRRASLSAVLQQGLAALLTFLLKLIRELQAAARRLTAFLRRQVTRFLDFLARRRARRKEKKIDSLPLLAGAATAAFLVCAVTAAYIALSLFAPYARNYSQVTVPSLQGKLIDEVELPDERFNLIIQYENNPDVENGRVISQSPSAGVTRKIYDKNGFCDIRVTVSRRVLPTVPDGLVGNTLRDASLSLLNIGLSFTVVEKYSELEKGTVLDSYPAEGESLSAGGSVTLTVSAGRAEILSDVPSLSGLTESEAIFRIKKSGFSVGNVTYVRSSQKAGTVISQSPSPRSSVKEGEDISFTVSAGEDFYTPMVPDLYGMSVSEAKEKLLSVGLTVSSVYSVSSAAKSGTVIYQSPIAGTPITSSITSVELHISN